MKICKYAKRWKYAKDKIFLRRVAALRSSWWRALAGGAGSASYIWSLNGGEDQHKSCGEGQHKSCGEGQHESFFKTISFWLMLTHPSWRPNFMLPITLLLTANSCCYQIEGNPFSTLCPNVPARSVLSPVLVVWVLVLALQVLNDVLQQVPLLHLQLTKEFNGWELFQPGLVLTQPGGEEQAERAWLELRGTLKVPRQVPAPPLFLLSQHLSPWTAAAAAVKNRSIWGCAASIHPGQRRPSTLSERQKYIISYLISSKRLSALYLAVPGCTWLCPAVPGSALVCHDLPFHRMPHTATDWPKCFCIYRLKCSKAINGINRWHPTILWEHGE